MPNGKARYHPTIDKRLPHWRITRHNQLQERKEWAQRDVKRRMKAAGTIEDKVPFNWEWCHNGEFGTVTGFNKSDVRAKVKQILNIPKKKRLPSEVQIRKVEFNEPIT